MPDLDERRAGLAVAGVFANRNAKSDFVFNEFVQRAESGCAVYIASAFFTNTEVVDLLLEKGCQVFMVVRLGFPTSADAIKKVTKNPNLQLRVYTGRSFHPKLYIFGDESALVGSANLTKAALMSNQEVVVSIGADDERFVELMTIFEEYWDGADVLNPGQLETYAKLCDQFDQCEEAAEALHRKVIKLFGDSSSKNIDRGIPAANKKSLFLSNFRRVYQEGVAAFNIVRRAYSAYGYRKAVEDDIPLTIEIDSFISYVRERFAVGETWRAAPLRSPSEQATFITGLISQWREVRWPHFEDTIVGTNYPRIKRVFASQDSIMGANDSDLFDALATLHSFHDRYRFFEGGLPSWKRLFPTFNDPLRTRETLSYLVHGKDDVVERMANAIYSPRYRLNEFGRANVQELVGWINRDALPIINGRTTKVLRYFGSRVAQL